MLGLAPSAVPTTQVGLSFFCVSFLQMTNSIIPTREKYFIRYPDTHDALNWLERRFHYKKRF
ncbi:MAG: hypothetical protein CMH56_10030 [Myxococcales bacterium]|nr:hypothetical protein [Myxococcales bacterium]